MRACKAFGTIPCHRHLSRAASLQAAAAVALSSASSSSPRQSPLEAALLDGAVVAAPLQPLLFVVALPEVVDALAETVSARCGRSVQCLATTCL
jgi:hypothetical protein